MSMLESYNGYQRLFKTCRILSTPIAIMKTLPRPYHELTAIYTIVLRSSKFARGGNEVANENCYFRDVKLRKDSVFD